MTDQIPIEHVPGEHNRDYLRAKRDKLGHLLHHQGLRARRADVPRGAASRDRARAAVEPTSRQGAASGLTACATVAACVGRFYEDLAERLVEGATRVLRRRRARSVDVHDVPGRVRAAAGGEGLRRVGPLRRRRLPRRGDPRRDRPLRLRLRRGRARDRARPARHRRAVRLRRADGREHGPGAGAHRRRQAPPGRGRRARGAADGRAAPTAARRRWSRSTSSATRRPAPARACGARSRGRGRRRAAPRGPDHDAPAGARGRAARPRGGAVPAERARCATRSPSGCTSAPAATS